MVDCSESDKTIKIRGKMDKSDTCNGFCINISFFIQEFLQTKHFFEFFYIQTLEEIDKITEKVKV